jgi:predicted transcriptional regulator
MNIQAEKLELIKMLVSIQDASILKKIKTLLEKEQPDDFFNHLNEQQVASIERGLEQVKKGKVVSHKQVKKLYDKWL